MNPRKVEDASDLANEVVGPAPPRHHLLKAKRIKELTLAAVEPPHRSFEFFGDMTAAAENWPPPYRFLTHK